MEPPTRPARALSVSSRRLRESLLSRVRGESTPPSAQTCSLNNIPQRGTGKRSPGPACNQYTAQLYCSGPTKTGIIAGTMSIENLVTEKFGPLQGVKIVSTGTLIAQPFAAALAAEMGAEVIQIERPGSGDVGWRTLGIQLPNREGGAPVATNWIQERRNVFCVTLDFSQARGRELFLKIAAMSDIWMESSKPGTYP